MNTLTVPAKAGTTLTPAEADLLAAFRAAADEAQPTMVRMMQSIAAGSPRRRPALTLVDAQRQHRRTAGLVDPFVLLMLAACAWIIYMLVQPAPAPAAPLAPTPGAVIAYTPYVLIDRDTGCQYLSTHKSTGLAPRIAADGKTHLGCKEVR